MNRETESVPCSLILSHLLRYDHRRANQPDAPIDKHYYCDAWSHQGECRRNPEFMEENCAESCKTVEEQSAGVEQVSC